MKRIVCALLAAALLLAPLAAARAEFDYESIPTPHMLVTDGDDLGRVFFERAADERAYPASTTKLMTCMLAIEAGKLDEQVTVGDEVLGTEEMKFSTASSLMGLKSGETLTLRDLIYGLMIVSGNDAAAAIAVHVGGSIEGFVTRMNEKAASLGMSGTHFTNPHGVQDENHYTTARDMAKLMAYALQNETFCEIDRTKTYTVPASNLRSVPLELVTTNRLLRKQEADSIDVTYPYAVGGKTGDTKAAGKCLVAVAEKDGARVIIVLFGDTAEMYGNDTDKTNLARFVNAKNIFEYAFEHEFAAVTGAELGLETAFAMPVSNADAADLPGGLLPVTADISGVVIRAATEKINGIRNGATALQPNIEAIDETLAPILQGQMMGYVHYLLNGAIVCSAPLTADRAVTASATGTVQAVADGEGSPFAPTSTPLIDRGRRDWTTGDYLLLALGLLVLLLIALIVVFIITERKRRFERKRRRARMRRG